IRQVRQHTVYHVAVANDLNHVARDHLEAHIDIRSVEEKKDEGFLRVTLQDSTHDGSFIVDLLLKNGLRLKTFKEEAIDLQAVCRGIPKGTTTGPPGPGAPAGRGKRTARPP